MILVIPKGIKNIVTIKPQTSSITTFDGSFSPKYEMALLETKKDKKIISIVKIKYVRYSNEL